MPVRELAPALIGFSDAVNATARILYPTAKRPSLAISATELGSFEAVMHILDPSWFESVTDLFSGKEATAAANVTTIFATLCAAITAVIKIGRRRIRRTDADSPEPGQTTIVLDDNSTVIVNNGVMILMSDSEFRHGAQAAASSLDEGMIDSLVVHDHTTSVTVTAEDARLLDVPPSGDMLLNDTVTTQVLHPVSPSFQEGAKWRVSDGQFRFWVRITDDAFIARVMNSETAIAADDLFRVRLRVQQWQGDEGLRVERTIEKVIEHIPGVRPVPLPFDDVDAPEGE